MAYGLRLRIEYKDINEVLTRINIYQDGYPGTADVRYAHSSFKAEWGDQGSEGMPLVYGSSCTLYFDAEIDYEFLYIFAADARKHLVAIEKASSLLWTGYIEPNAWSEPLTATPYPVECTAYDMLGFLNKISFTDDLGVAYDGKKTWFDILKICLLKTGLDLTINTAIDWKELDKTEGTDLLKVHQANCDAFVGLSCYEVIEQLLHECRIMQRSGQWWIISNSNWVNETFPYFTTTPAGSTSSGTLNPTASGFWVEGEMTMEMLPAIKQLVVVQDYGYKENLAKNGSFADYNDELTRFEGWINNGVTPQQRALNDDGEKYVYIPGIDYPDTFGNQGYGLITDSIEKQLQVSATTSMFSLSLKYAEMGALGSKISSLMFISVKLIGTSETYYLRRSPWVRQEQEFEWVTAGDWHYGELGDDRITLKSTLKQSNDPKYYVWLDGYMHEGEDLPKLYYNTFENVTAYPADKIADHFESFKASVMGIPVSGTLELFLYVPYTNRPQIGGSCFTGIKIEILDEAAEKYPSTKSFKVINSLRNNYVPEDITTLIGDYPDMPNSDLIYSGGISRLDNSHTEGWALQGDTTYYTHSELIARLMASAQRMPRQSYQARLADMIPRMNLVIEDENNPGIRLIENGITYDDRYQAIDGRYTEILTIDFSEQTLETAITFDTPTNLTTGSSSAAPVNVEERVTIIDEKSATVSNPGYLDADYFESVTSEEDGLTRIRTIVGIGAVQTVHGFTVGTAIKHDGTNWVKSQADTAAHAGVAGIVCTILDENNFRYLNGGLLRGFYTEGARHFLSWTTAGELVEITYPETWAIGVYRQYIGMGVPGGLMIEIDDGAEVVASGLQKADIPYDIDFGFADFTLGTAKTYVVDLKAKKAYTIQGIVLRCDTGTITGFSVKINGTPVTSLSSVTINNTITEITATGANTVALGDLVTLEFPTGYTGTPTIFDGKLLRQLI